MKVSSETLEKYEKQTMESKSRFIWMKKMKNHIELVAALLSGLLILCGWILRLKGMDDVSILIYILSFLIGGFAKAKEGILDTIENRDLNVELLMIFAAIGSGLIGYWEEGAILIFIFSLSGALETYTLNRSKKEISALMEKQPEEATLLVNGTQKKVHVSKLKVGDMILVKPGERIPVDGNIVKGGSTIDESAITGESIPINKKVEDEVYAGTVNITGSITIEVTKLSTDTLFQKIIKLVRTAQSEKSPSQQFIERFESTYVKVVLVSVLIMMFLPHYLFHWSWGETFYRAMILLVVASPCALVASIMPATLSAISNGAKNGILVKGGVNLEKLCNIKAIAFDKTGTLTKGKPEVTDFIVIEQENKDYIKQIAASIENHSNHPLAKAIVQFGLKDEVQLVEPDRIKDVPGYGLEAEIQGDVWKIGKADFIGVDIDHDSFPFKEEARKLVVEGKTVVYIQKNDTLVGVYGLKDSKREDAKEAVQHLNDLGIHTIMLTGDHQQTASVIAKEIQLKDFISECLPQTKVQHLKRIKEKYKNVAMVGDGINDAPALASANVGIAMGEGTDVALETADIILMKNELSKISKSFQLSQKMNRIIKQNIIFSISVIIILIFTNFFQILDLPLGVIGHEGSTILVILNGLRLLKG